MKQFVFLICFFSFLLFAFRGYKDDSVFIKENFTYADEQIKLMIKDASKNRLAFPRTITKNGKLVTTSMYDWTPGFFPGNLWLYVVKPKCTSC